MDTGKVYIGTVVGKFPFSVVLRFEGGGLVEVIGPDGGIRKYSDRRWLHLDESSGGEEHLFFPPFELQADRPRPDTGQKRCMSRQYTEFTDGAGSNAHLHHAGEDFLFRADDTAMYGSTFNFRESGISYMLITSDHMASVKERYIIKLNWH